MSAKKDDAPFINENSSPSLITDALEILTVPRLQYLLLASFFRFSAGLIIAVWAAPYYKQVFPDNTAEYAVINAFIKGALGMTSGIVGGYLAGNLSSWMSTRMIDSISNVLSIMDHYFDGKTILLLLPIVSSVLAIPTWHLATHPWQGSNSFESAMFWLSVEYLVAECWFGPTIAVLQSSGYCARDFFFFAGAIGNISPALLGWMYGSPHFEMPLADLLSFSVSGGYLISAICFIASVGKETSKHTPVEAK
ncbi:hypothetical protein ACHAW6_012350 [Cyclotella cf. meneghiniana]